MIITIMIKKLERIKNLYSILHFHLIYCENVIEPKKNDKNN